ncbi:uncharacterized protein PAC_04128 [Phialocephala subalpina]|uniref:Uncharacterized protein n=1 Tax=Phialocephala subalpina TaxID=576137 RepID=A0A1L7WN99_9HELO|nr:uncharacterized protein PAC_04128 [Phialocephala subalpina]
MLCFNMVSQLPTADPFEAGADVIKFDHHSFERPSAWEAHTNAANHSDSDSEGRSENEADEDDLKVPRELTEIEDYSKLRYPYNMVKRHPKNMPEFWKKPKDRQDFFGKLFITRRGFIKGLDRENPKIRFTVKQYHQAWEYAINLAWDIVVSGGCHKKKFDISNFRQKMRHLSEAEYQEELDRQKKKLVESIRDYKIIGEEERMRLSQNSADRRRNKAMKKAEPLIAKAIRIASEIGTQPEQETLQHDSASSSGKRARNADLNTDIPELKQAKIETQD